MVVMAETVAQEMDKWHKTRRRWWRCLDTSTYGGQSSGGNGADGQVDYYLDTLRDSSLITQQPAGDEVCEGAPVTFTVTAEGEDLTYQWRRGTTEIATGSAYTIGSVSADDAADDYNVLITNGCGASIASVNVTLTVDENPVATIVDYSDITCFGGSDGEITIGVEGGEAPYSYSIENGENSEESEENSYTFENLEAGDYEIKVIDNNECESQQ